MLVGTVIDSRMKSVPTTVYCFDPLLKVVALPPFA
jgi:hypothetical protein